MYFENRTVALSVSEGLFWEEPDDTSTASMMLEVDGLDRLKRPLSRYPVKPFDTVDRFGDVTSNIFPLVQQFSTIKRRQLSKEESFIQRRRLQSVIKVAKQCITELFGSGVETSLEYCKDPDGTDFEWIDYNIHVRNVDDSQIAELLARVDTLTAEFENRVGITASLNINFYLDIT